MSDNSSDIVTSVCVCGKVNEHKRRSENGDVVCLGCSTLYIPQLQEEVKSKNFLPFDKEIPKLGRFLFKHVDHELVFLADNDHNDSLEYSEFEEE